jgi:hypothetical protein
VPGRYHLTAWTFYGIVPDPAPVTKMTLVITGDTIEVGGQNTVGPASGMSFSYSTVGSAITQIKTCPLPQTTSMATYTATATQLTTYSAVNAGVSNVQVFTKE